VTEDPTPDSTEGSTEDPNTQACTLVGLHLHPIKSCGSVLLQEALLVETGLDLDRAWMVVDGQGQMLTQRQWPRMALIQPTFKGDELVLRAPGMLALHLRLDTVETATHAQVHRDVVKAFSMGALAAQWFSDFLGTPAHLVRFDPEQQRLADLEWTGGVAAETAFADAFPLLVANAASLADFNARLAARGAGAVTLQRFRPNLVFSGWQAWDEDHIDEIALNTGDGPVRLKLVKPCTRCTIPDVDPVTAATSHEVGDLLTTFRADPRMKGATTFGINAIVLEGLGCTLRVGQVGSARFSF
jgi:hypothetical protein